MANSSNPDPSDLGLRLTPFERCYDPNAEILIEADDAPFDPQIEAERAARIVSMEEYSEDGAIRERLRFSEPLFDKMPGPERAAWWAEHLVALRDPAKWRAGWSGTDFDWPTWLRVVLRTDWDAPLHTTARCVKKAPETTWVLRGIVRGTRKAGLKAAHTELLASLAAPVGQNPHRGYELVDPAVFAALALEAIDPAVARQLLVTADDKPFCNGYYLNPPLLGLVLHGAAERIGFAKQRGLTLTRWEGVLPWLVATGREGFKLLIEWMNHQPRDTATSMLKVAADAGHGPGMTELFIDALHTEAAPVAEAWLRSHMPQALAADLSAKQSKALIPFLRELSFTERRAAAEYATGPAAVALGELLAELDVPELPLDTSWWVAAATQLPEPQVLPFEFERLSPVLVDDGHRLGLDQVGSLLRALRAEQGHPLVAAVREHADPSHLDCFAVTLLNCWLAAGAPAKLSWLMTSTGRLGGDRFVNTLTPLIREWPGVSHHQRAVKGLTALRNVASDEALQQISGIAAKVKFAGLKKRAGQAMDEIAAQRGFTRDELEDRVIPDGGLDERGTRVFDYGTRRFLAYVTPEGKLAARLLDTEGHPTGKVLSTLPAPNKSDDTERAKAAKTEYNLVKKAVTTLAKVQLARFERAMIQDRRWTPEDHARFIAPHPVLRRLLAGIIWGLHDTENTLTATARIDEDGRLVDTDDEPVDTDGCSIGIVHPLELDEASKAAWGEVLADYELVQPFKQLDRPIFHLPDDQGDDTKLHDLPKGRFPATKLIGAFNKYGWERGEALDAGVYCIHALTIPTADLTAVICYTGMWMGPMTEQDDQEIEAAYILKGHHEPKNLGWGNELDTKRLERVPWNQVPPKIVSEILAALKEMSNT